MVLSLACLNINGGRAPIRKTHVRLLLDQKHVDVALLQDVRCGPTCSAEWQTTIRGSWFFSSFDCCRAGVAFWFRSSFSSDQIVFHEFMQGHLAFVVFSYGGYKITLLNAYVPSNPAKRNEYFSILDDCLSQIDFSGLVCLAGDFNCTLEPALDRNGSEPHPESAKGFATILAKYNLVDGWRLQHPKVKQYSWCQASNNRVSFARLDRFYVNNDFRNFILSTAISPSGFSDHHLVSLKLTFPYLQRRSAYWALNVSLLEDIVFCNAFRIFWTSLYGRKNTFHSKLQWWDIVKIHIKIFCQQFKLHHSRDSLSMITILEKEVLELQRNPLELNRNQGLRKEFITKKELLHSLVNERAKGALVRLKIKNLSLFDTSSKFFFSLERKTKAQHQLLSVQSPEGGIVSEPKMIKRIVVDYFSSLFCAKKIDLNVAKAFIEPLPKLSESQRASLESSITLEELGLALSSMASGKAPGLDGIPCEFYKTFWDIIGPELLEVLKESFQVGELPLSFRRAVVSLLPKKGDTQLLRNWRPVSLLTTDYKIFSKVLASRLKLVVHSLVHPDQTCCVPGRSIYDNLGAVRDIVDVCDLLHKSTGLIFIDQEHAFDSIDHSYLFAILKGFGFGRIFVSYIQLLYHNIYSLFKINNELIPPFTVTRGIRQGCPLSGLLYVLSIEPLLVKLREKLVGFSVAPDIPAIKVVAYADDICTTIQCQEDVSELLKTMNNFTLACSARVNWTKSYASFFGLAMHFSFPTLPNNLSWKNNSVYHLGVHLGDAQSIQKNWDGLTDKVYSRLQRWRGLLCKLSYHGRVLVINNLVSSILWHRFIVLQPPAWLIKNIQKHLIDFFLGW